MKRIDLNADLGEGGPDDAALMALVSSANIACGGHAGNADTMRTGIRLAMAAGVSIGAHPGYEDREHFGRRPLDLPPAQVREMVENQLRSFREIARGEGADVNHVKPHGALYNQADRSPNLAAAVAEAARSVFPEAALFGPPAGCLEAAARTAGLEFVAEGFADRRYLPDGSLVPRSEPDAVIENPDEAVAQALEIARDSSVRTRNGPRICLPAKTLCVHGDGPASVDLLRSLRKALESNGFTIGR